MDRMLSLRGYARTFPTYAAFRESLTLAVGYGRFDELGCRLTIRGPDGTARVYLSGQLERLQQYVLSPEARLLDLGRWNRTVRFLLRVLRRSPLRFLWLLLSVKRWHHVGPWEIYKVGVGKLASRFGYDAVRFWDPEDRKASSGLLVFRREVLLPIADLETFYTSARG